MTVVVHLVVAHYGHQPAHAGSERGWHDHASAGQHEDEAETVSTCPVPEVRVSNTPPLPGAPVALLQPLLTDSPGWLSAPSFGYSQRILWPPGVDRQALLQRFTL
jgi:hypothetical protein